MKIIVVGLGKMGAQIAKRFVGAGHRVIALDPSKEAVEAVLKIGASTASNRKEAAEAFAGEKEKIVVWLMIPAAAVDKELNEWLTLLPRGSVVIDGGNSDFRETMKRSKKAEERGVSLVDVGTSGGVLGEKNGFSMMVGGSPDAFKTIEPLLEAMAEPNGGYHYFGESGSGHYIKMVHNAIEYGIMESLAEGYRMLREGPFEGLELAAAGDVWQRASIIKSDLNELCAQVMHENPELADISGYVAESGEARWTLEAADKRGITLPAIQASFEVRLASQSGNVHFGTKLLAALRHEFGGHPINKDL